MSEVAPLLGQLKRGTWEERLAATESLRAVVAEDELVVMALQVSLGDEAAAVRSRVAEVLGAATPSEAVSAALLACLEDDEASVRQSALEALASQAVYPDGERLVVGRLDDEDADVRGAAARLLGLWVGWLSAREVAAALLAGAQGVSEEELEPWLFALSECGPVACLAAPWLWQLARRPGPAQAQAVEALGWIADPDEPLLSSLAEWLGTPGLWGAAAIAAGGFGRPAARVAPRLRELTEADDEELAGRAAWALGRVARRGDRASLAALVAAARRDDGRAERAAGSVGRLASAGDGATAADVAGALGSVGDAQARVELLFALTVMGTYPPSGRAAIEALCDDPHGPTRGEAIRALASGASADDEAARGRVVAGLQDPEPRVRMLSMRGALRLRDAYPWTIPLIVGLLEDDAVCGNAAETLGLIGLREGRVVEGLRALIARGIPHLTEIAETALRRLGA